MRGRMDMHPLPVPPLTVMRKQRRSCGMLPTLPPCITAAERLRLHRLLRAKHVGSRGEEALGQREIAVNFETWPEKLARMGFGIAVFAVKVAGSVSICDGPMTLPPDGAASGCGTGRPRAALRTLGGFELVIDQKAVEVSSNKARALLVYLALENRPVPRERLADLLWPDRGEREARQSLRQAVATLRRLFDDSGSRHFVGAEGNSALKAANIWHDASEFIKPARDLDLEGRADLYRGDFLGGIASVSEPFDNWAASERRRLNGIATDVLTTLAKLHLDTDPERSLQVASKALRLDPLQEEAHRLVMLGYFRLGRRSDALRQYETCASILRQELQVEPEERTKQLASEIRDRSAIPASSQGDLPVAALLPQGTILGSHPQAPIREALPKHPWLDAIRLAGAAHRKHLLIASLALGGVITAANVASSKPDALQYSFTVWPKGTIPPGEMRTSETKSGKLLCYGGSVSPKTPRKCSWN